MRGKDHCHGTQGSTRWSWASGPRGRALEALADPARAKGAIRRIADELGVHPEALSTWVRQAWDRTRAPGREPPPRTLSGSRSRRWRSEKLRRANAILKSVSACLSRRSVSARPVDLPVHRDQEGGARGPADLCHAQRGWCTDRPEHLTHARRSRPPSARSLRDETLQGGDIQGPQEPATRCWGLARCTRCGADPRSPSVTVPVTWSGAPPVRLMGDLGLHGVRRQVSAHHAQRAAGAVSGRPCQKAFQRVQAE